MANQIEGDPDGLNGGHDRLVYAWVVGRYVEDQGIAWREVKVLLQWGGAHSVEAHSVEALVWRRGAVCS